MDARYTSREGGLMNYASLLPPNICSFFLGICFIRSKKIPFMSIEVAFHDNFRFCMVRYNRLYRLRDNHKVKLRVSVRTCGAI